MANEAASAAAERKSAAWWDDFWRRPLAATGRALTCRRTAEEALRLLKPALASLPPRRRLRVLDLGCGHGDLTLELLHDDRLEIVALDLSASALRQFAARLNDFDPSGRPIRPGEPGRAARSNGSTTTAAYADRLALVRASVYELPFRDAAFDAVVSFGYASAASYDGAEREVARVLRRGGVAVVDFANPSLYRWLAAPRPTLRWLQRYRDPAQSQYHFGRPGLREHFGRAALILDTVAYLNAYPPLERLAAQPWCATLDRTLSRAAGPLLGRVLLARLRRSDTNAPPRS